MRVRSGHAHEWAEYSLHSLARGSGWLAYLQGVSDELLKPGLRPAGWEGVSKRYQAAVGLRGTIIPIRATSGVSFELLD